MALEWMIKFFWLFPFWTLLARSQESCGNPKFPLQSSSQGIWVLS